MANDTIYKIGVAITTLGWIEIGEVVYRGGSMLVAVLILAIGFGCVLKGYK